MVPRRPLPDDAEALARLHVQAWAETYAGLLPADEIAAFDLSRRRRQWQHSLTDGATRVVWVPGAGFASAGVQRDAGLARAGWPDELYTLYVLRAAQGRGLGRALLRAVVGEAAFSALVVDGNTRACRFYDRTGARLLTLRDEAVGTTTIRERVYVWDKGRVREDG